MATLGDQINAIVCLDGKNELPAFDRDQLHSGRDLHAGRRCGLVANVNVSTDCLLQWPVKIWVDGLDAGPFKKADQKTSSKDFRHYQEFLRFRVERRNSF